jgi:spermidine synthase
MTGDPHQPRLMTHGKRQLFYLPGIFCISAAGLGFEIVLTRLFTVAIGYPFAYLVISLALLGYGAAGAFLRVMPGLVRHARRRLLLIGPLFFTLTLLSAYWLVNRLPFDPVQIIWDSKQLFYLLLMLFLLFVPFFFTGLTLAACFVAREHEIGRCYFADLSGAAFGCFLPVMLFYHGWDERILLLLAAGGCLSLLFFALALQSRRTLVAPLATMVCLLVIFLPSGSLSVRISPWRDLMVALRHDEARLLRTEWNALSRIDIVDSPAVRFAPGLSLRYAEPLPPQFGLTVDGSNLQAMTAIEPARMAFLGHLPSALAYQLKVPENVFIYDFGGGQDVLAACFFGANRIDASERDAGVISAVTDYYDRAGRHQAGWFDRAELNILNADGRRYLRAGTHSYDLIVLPLTGAISAGSGLFSSGEDYRFTVEAIRDYYENLTEGGYLTVSRYLQAVPTEAIKLPLTLIEALEDRADLPGSMITIRSWSTWTVLLKKGTLDQYELTAMRQFCADNGFDLVYYPGITEAEANRFNRFAEPVYYRIWQNLFDETARSQLTDQYMFRVTPATDDAPFYHNYFSWDRLGQIMTGTSGNWRILIQGGFLIPVILFQSILLSVILILLPVWMRKKATSDTLSRRVRATLLLYFLMIGIGYMFFEITLISRMVVLFDTTTLAMTVVIVSLLLSSGLGSLWLDRRLHRPHLAYRLIPLMVAGLLLLYALFLPALIRIILPLPNIWRVALTALMLCPAGFLMGMPFPLGLSLAGRADRSFIPWAWCANGCASVISASLAITLALSWGYARVTVIAGVAYFAAACFMMIFHHFMASPVIGTKATSAM